MQLSIGALARGDKGKDRGRDSPREEGSGGQKDAWVPPSNGQRVLGPLSPSPLPRRFTDSARERRWVLSCGGRGRHPWAPLRVSACGGRVTAPAHDGMKVSLLIIVLPHVTRSSYRYD